VVPKSTSLKTNYRIQKNMYLPNLPSLIRQPLTQQAMLTDEKSTKLSLSKLRRSKGFTLIEILVVMAIIATLLGLGVGTIKNLASSKGVSTAVPLADSIFAQARQVAKSSGVPTRVVIYADTSGDNKDKRSRYLRMMGVATGRVGGVPATKGEAIDEWRFVSRPIILPSNTFFNATLSNKTTTDGQAIFSGDTTPKDCYVYEFNSEGALIEPSNDGGGLPVTDGQFVVQAGQLKPGQNTPDTDRKATRDVGGFKIWANGRMAMFRSPNQILSGSGDAEF
jgi:prepilin-type N-terminal cleavage/methylation domain-containing protein